MPDLGSEKENMMKEKFEDWNPREPAVVMLRDTANIMTEYSIAGYNLTLRQLYYRIVALDLFPEDRRWAWTGSKWIRDSDGTKNADPNYKWLGDVVGKGRMAGILDWDIIVDRHRKTSVNPHWPSPKEALQSVANIFAIDKWENQPFHLEVMVEKDALAGILEPICSELDVHFTANKGYSSLSHLYEIGTRLGALEKDIVLLYFGDHDPSGMDMDRDLFDRLSLFSDIHFEFERLALTMPQIEEHDPPPNPNKMTDPRAQGYVRQYGNDSWELDALEPKTLEKLLRTAIAQYRDDSLWDETVNREETMRKKIKKIADTWEAKRRNEDE